MGDQPRDHAPGRRGAAAPLAVLAASLIGVAAGVGGFTFSYGRGASYLSNDPAACANCHIMQGQFDGWLQGSHRAVATCNDCHTPHTFPGKYIVKGRNGFWHSYAFTTGDFHEPIQIKAGNLEVTETACRDCHEEMVHVVDGPLGDQPRSCVQCHRDVGHRH